MNTQSRINLPILKNGKRTYLIIAAVLLFGMLLAACNLPSSKGEPTPDVNLISTLVHQTAEVRATQAGVQTAVAQMTQISENSPTPPATATMAATSTATPVPTATATLVPTATRVPPTATATPQPCDAAKFVLDVTIEDGTKLAPGASFTKTWRLKNVGTCTWTKSYDIVYVKGDKLTSTTTFPLPNNVAPGEQVELSVNLYAPTKAGTYESFFMLENQNGNDFGIGAGADQSFWVKIVVAEVSVAYNFTTNYCGADWRNGSANVSCPGTLGSDSGAVVKVDNPTLETGSSDDEAALRVEPQKIDNGVLTGKYPEFEVKSGDHFKSVIGCWDGTTNCKVTFKLQYQVGDGAVQTLGTWSEAYDKQVTKVDVDLSSLAGKKVKFILYIAANGAWNQSSGHWLLPRILR